MIFSADIHARYLRPKARKDNYLETQDKKLRFLCQLAQKSPPWLISGDLFNNAHPGDWILGYIISLFKEYNVCPAVIPGQHDMPDHSLEIMKKDSGLNVLKAAGVISLLPTEEKDGGFLWDDDLIYGCPYGQQPPTIEEEGWNKILLWHNMVIKDDPLWNKQIASTGERILRKYPMFDIICTGDNHNTFVCENKGRFLVNPGSMMRMKTNQKDHKPCVFRWDKGNLEQIFLPIEEDVFDDSHITEKEEKENRLDGFITKLNEIRPELNENSSVSFKGNLKNFFQVNPETRGVEEITWRCVPKDRK